MRTRVPRLMDRGVLGSLVVLKRHFGIIFLVLLTLTLEKQRVLKYLIICLDTCIRLYLTRFLCILRRWVVWGRFICLFYNACFTEITLILSYFLASHLHIVERSNCNWWHCYFYSICFRPPRHGPRISAYPSNTNIWAYRSFTCFNSSRYDKGKSWWSLSVSFSRFKDITLPLPNLTFTSIKNMNICKYYFSSPFSMLELIFREVSPAVLVIVLVKATVGVLLFLFNIS